MCVCARACVCASPPAQLTLSLGLCAATNKLEISTLGSSPTDAAKWHKRCDWPTTLSACTSGHPGRALLAVATCITPYLAMDGSSRRTVKASPSQAVACNMLTQRIAICARCIQSTCPTTLRYPSAATPCCAALQCFTTLHVAATSITRRHRPSSAGTRGTPKS